ncbi:hypothetical protein TNCV_167031 [Trichonephila clavipes]|nr:hypothetical protein TNCV_167031 [Trichonephila clavipes]
MKQWTPCGHSTLLQTASNGTSEYRVMRNRLNLLLCCAMACDVSIHLPSRIVVQRGGCDGPVDSSFSPAYSHDKSAS